MAASRPKPPHTTAPRRYVAVQLFTRATRPADVVNRQRGNRLPPHQSVANSEGGRAWLSRARTKARSTVFRLPLISASEAPRASLIETVLRAREFRGYLRGVARQLLAVSGPIAEVVADTKVFG